MVNYDVFDTVALVIYGVLIAAAFVVIVEINPDPYRYSFNEAAAQADAARQTVGEAKAKVDVTRADVSMTKAAVTQAVGAVAQAKAAVTSAEAALTKAKAAATSAQAAVVRGPGGGRTGQDGRHCVGWQQGLLPLWAEGGSTPVMQMHLSAPK